MAKVNVSLPDDLLHDVDALADELHSSRSGFVAEATAKYTAEVRAELVARGATPADGGRVQGGTGDSQARSGGRDVTELIREDSGQRLGAL